MEAEHQAEAKQTPGCFFCFISEFYGYDQNLAFAKMSRRQSAKRRNEKPARKKTKLSFIVKFYNFQLLCLSIVLTFIAKVFPKFFNKNTLIFKNSKKKKIEET